MQQIAIPKFKIEAKKQQAPGNPPLAFDFLVKPWVGSSLRLRRHYQGLQGNHVIQTYGRSFHWRLSADNAGTADAFI
jgi:hypothetical protein